MSEFVMDSPLNSRLPRDLSDAIRQEGLPTQCEKIDYFKKFFLEPLHAYENTVREQLVRIETESRRLHSNTFLGGLKDSPIFISTPSSASLSA